MALDRNEVNGGYQYERIGFILKVQDENYHTLFKLMMDNS